MPVWVRSIAESVDIDDVEVVDCGRLAKLKLGGSVEMTILEVKTGVEIELELIIEVEKILGREFELW